MSMPNSGQGDLTPTDIHMKILASGRSTTTNHGARIEWPVAEPNREEPDDLELMVRFPHSAGPNSEQFASVVARRLQVIFGEGVVVMTPHVPYGRDKDDPEWFEVTPAEGI